jgi:signal transduction histidine kinase
MSEIIWTLNPQNDTFEDLLAYLREQLNHYFEPLNVNYFIYFPEQIPDIRLSNEQRRNLFLVTKEAINNSLRHSGASRIEIIVQAEGNRIDFSIIDNGKGINEMKKRAGANGLHNMQQRMKDINGSIEWVSENGAGTRVNYSINV